MKLHKRAWIIVSTIVATMAIAVLGVNLSLGDKQIDLRPQHLYAVAHPQFLRTMGVMLGPSLTDGNRVEALLNGEQIFPAMLEAIRAAKHTITFETYIYWSGSIGKAFADALAERARAGVKVHVLIDWVGSRGVSEGDAGCGR
jgi:cardiolipin synthase A/B